MELSKTEYKVCENIARGHSVKEIAVKMYRSPYTIDSHIKNVKKKNGLSNIADIVREFILSLDEPKQYFRVIVTAVFITIQGLAITNPDLDDYRTSRSSSRTVRTTRTSGKNKIEN